MAYDTWKPKIYNNTCKASIIQQKSNVNTDIYTKKKKKKKNIQVI